MVSVQSGKPFRGQYFASGHKTIMYFRKVPRFSVENHFTDSHFANTHLTDTGMTIDIQRQK